MPRTIYVIGAGLAGLAAATKLADAGEQVVVFEQSPGPGGRCRSFFDSKLNADIDNGNHLVMSGNTDAMAYLERIGAQNTVDILPARYPFVDLETGESWTIDLGQGRIPWWILSAKKRIPGTNLRDYWASRSLMAAKQADTVAETLEHTERLYERFWKPFSVAVLNTEPEAAAADLMKPVMTETLMKGGHACRPVLAKRGLGYSFAEPAIDYLQGKNARINMGHRCRRIELADNKLISLHFDSEDVVLADGDLVVSAVPPNIAAELLPFLSPPDVFRSILNVHYHLQTAPHMAPITGLLGSLAEWVFCRGNTLSVTVSAADEHISQAHEEISRRVWTEIAPLAGLDPIDVPSSRVIKEKRATIAQTPEMIAMRPSPETPCGNLFLAGDWTDTGLPATIEGAIRSGHVAGAKCLNA